MKEEMHEFSLSALDRIGYEVLPQALLDAIPFGVLITDENLKLTQVNQWTTIHLGRPAADLVDRPIGEVFPEITERKLIQAYRLVLQSHSALTISNRIHRYLIKMPPAPDCGLANMPQSAVIVPVLDQSTIHGTLTYINDVTDRVMTEVALQHEVEKLNALREIDRALSTLDLQACLQTIVTWAEKLFQTNGAALFLLENEELRPVELRQPTNQPPLKAGGAKWVVEHQTPLLAADMPADSGDENAPLPWMRSEMAVPMMNDGTIIGVLAVQSQQPNAFSQEDLGLMEALAARGGLAIHNARLHQEERTQRELAEALHEVSLVLTAHHDPDAVLNDLLESMQQVIPYDSACVMILEEGNIRVKQHRGYDRFTDMAAGFEQSSLEDLPSLQILSETRRPFAIPDTRANPIWKRGTPFLHVQSWAGAPILVRDEVIGFLSLDKTEPGFYTPERVRHLAAFAVQSALALENARLYKEQQLLAATDGLTGVSNRRKFDEVLKYELERARRFERPLSLIMCDLDNFKQYNDTFGHPVGDHLLKNLAESLRTQIRGSDTLARYGGEEFVCVLPETGLSQAYVIAERLRQSAANLHLAFPLADFAIPNHQVTISVGIASLTQSMATPDELIKAADMALYDAKMHGKNRVAAWVAENASPDPILSSNSIPGNDYPKNLPDSIQI